MRPLTEKQKELYDYIVAHIKETGSSPSQILLARYFGITPHAIVSRLLALEKKGYIRVLNYQPSKIVIL